MNKYIKYISLVFLPLFLACEGFLDEDPKGLTFKDKLFNSEQTITNTFMTSYQSLRGVYAYRQWTLMTGLTADEIQCPGTTKSSRIEVNNYTFTPNNMNIQDQYRDFYRSIAHTNLVLENIPREETSDISQSFINNTIAEAHFMRGWCYFNLARLYKNPPLVLEYENMDRFPSRSDEENLWNWIISDLRKGAAETDDGISFLPNWQNNPERGRATTGAAKAALGWAYATRASLDIAKNTDLDSAYYWLKRVIDEEGYELWDNYYDAFYVPNENGKEDVFSYQCNTEAGDDFFTYSGSDFSPINSPDLIGRNEYGTDIFQLTEKMYWAFEEGDERKERIFRGDYNIMIEDTIGDGFYGWRFDDHPDAPIYTTDESEYNDTARIAYTQKWIDFTKTDATSTKHNVNHPIIRYSNVLLLHSEVANELAKPIDEILYGVNLVRERAELAPLEVSLSQSELREAIRHERFVELHTEGVRWFDLQRWGNKKQAVEEAKPYVTVYDLYEYFPIPQTEIDVNPNLTNPGWE